LPLVWSGNVPDLRSGGLSAVRLNAGEVIRADSPSRRAGRN